MTEVKRVEGYKVGDKFFLRLSAAIREMIKLAEGELHMAVKEALTGKEVFMEARIKALLEVCVHAETLVDLWTDLQSVLEAGEPTEEDFNKKE